MKKIIALLLCSLLMAGCSNISIEDMPKEVKNEADYILPSDSKTITEDDLKKLGEKELEYAHQEIFARHGKLFDDENYVKYFTSTKWYRPDPSYNDNALSDLERENETRIRNYIKKNLSLNTKAENNNKTETEEETEKETETAPAKSKEETAPKEEEKSSDDYLLADSSTRKLTKEELIKYPKETLAYMRNEIFARHGYVFKTEKYSNYFSSKPWYKPDPSFKENDISKTEKYNVNLIKSLEQ